MCCKLAKGHSQVTELATKLLSLRFQKHRSSRSKEPTPLSLEFKALQAPIQIHPSGLGSCLSSCPLHMCGPQVAVPASRS